MSKLTLGSLFSGGGLFDMGAMAAGFDVVKACEFNPEPKYGTTDCIAEWYRRNIGDHCLCQSVLDVDPAEFMGVDAIHASPPCPNFSVAKTGGGETELDIALANAIVRIFTHCRPRFVTVENVQAYQKSRSFEIILRALTAAGYQYKYGIVDAADFGGATPCPIHDYVNYALPNCRRVTAQDIVAVSVMMQDLEQAKLLAWDAAVGLVEAIPRDTVGSAIWRKLALEDYSDHPILLGGAENGLMRRDMSNAVLMDAKLGSIDWLLSKCLVDRLWSERWYTTSTEIIQITIRLICKCLAATPNIAGQRTTLGQGEAPCPICKPFRGVPQNRLRLILRAVLDGPVPPLIPTHCDPRKLTQYAGQGQLFGEDRLLPWNGWYAAIEDLLPQLPDSQFADWQLARLPQELKNLLVELSSPVETDKETMLKDADMPGPTITSSHGAGKYRAMLIENQQNIREATVRDGDDPMFTVNTGNTGIPSHMPIAFVCDGQPNHYGEDMTLRDAMEPMITIMSSSDKKPLKAFLTDGQTGSGGTKLPIMGAEEPASTITSSDAPRGARAYANGRVVKLSTRCLARFQTIPDRYELPKNNSLAGRLIGNGVPVNLAQAIMGSLRGGAK